VEKSIIDYINRLRAQGYDTGTIRTQLIQAGYDPRQVEQALSYSAPKVISAKTIAIIGGCVILGIILLVVVIKLLAPEPKYIELSLQPTQTSFEAGKKLTFLKKITSETERKAEVKLLHIVTDSANNNVAQKKELLNVGRRLSTQTQISLPKELGPGTYTLSTTAEYDGKTEYASFTFDIIEAAEIEFPIEDVPELAALECPQGCDDFDVCTQDDCVEGICKHTPVKPCCGNVVCEAGETKANCPDDCVEREKTPDEVIYQAAQLSQTDVQSAGNICATLGRTTYADSCYAEVAVEGNEAEFCDQVIETKTKDRCYLLFATENDNYSTCEFIVNAYFSKSCYALSRTSAAKVKAGQA